MIGEKISIITISYNSNKTIVKTFESVLSQSYRPLEYILVDGGSKDGTLELIEKYIPQFEAVGIAVNFKSETDKGISDAFNKGIDRATGDIIGITNSDDCLLDGTLQFVANNFPVNIDVFYGNCIWNDEDNHIQYVRKSNADLSDLKIRLKILHPAAYIRKTAYNKYGVYSIDYRFCMDKQLLAKMQRMGASFQYVDKNFVSVSAGGASDKNLKGVIVEGEKIAIDNGISPIQAKWIFRKNYLFVRTKNMAKKISFVSKIVEKSKK